MQAESDGRDAGTRFVVQLPRSHSLTVGNAPESGDAWARQHGPPIVRDSTASES